MLPKLGSKGIDNLVIYVIGSTKRHPGGTLPLPLPLNLCKLFYNYFRETSNRKTHFCALKSFRVIY